jgi:hypothetical protein
MQARQPAPLCLAFYTRAGWRTRVICGLRPVSFQPVRLLGIIAEVGDWGSRPQYTESDDMAGPHRVVLSTRERSAAVPIDLTWRLRVDQYHAMIRQGMLTENM